MVVVVDGVGWGGVGCTAWGCVDAGLIFYQVYLLGNTVPVGGINKRRENSTDLMF
jgi:hypothetical protein